MRIDNEGIDRREDHRSHRDRDSRGAVIGDAALGEDIPWLDVELGRTASDSRLSRL
jgi:hypothetical protein